MESNRSFQYLQCTLTYQKSSPASLESLPAEIKSMIINGLPDLKTLQCLVLASPSYHAVYADRRETILTKFTIRELESRDVNLFQPMTCLCVFHRKSDAATDTSIVDAVKACVKWIRPPKRFRLSVGFCLDLLRVERALPVFDEDSLLLCDDAESRELSRESFLRRTRGVSLDMKVVSVDSQS